MKWKRELALIELKNQGFGNQGNVHAPLVAVATAGLAHPPGADHRIGGDSVPAFHSGSCHAGIR